MSNCPYCNNVGQNKEHDKNPDKFHAWMGDRTIQKDRDTKKHSS